MNISVTVTVFSPCYVRMNYCHVTSLFVFRISSLQKIISYVIISSPMVSFGAVYPADVHTVIPADVRGQELRSSSQNVGKNKRFGADVHDPKAQTSMTPGGFERNFGQKTSG